MSSRRALANRGEVVSALGVVAPPPIQIHAPNFEGSLGMLFECVRERKIDLFEIPLYPICEAYYLYLVNLPLADFDSAATALQALAYLLERKAFLLLPIPEKAPEEPEASLALELPSIDEFFGRMVQLKQWRDERSRWFFRTADASESLYELPFTLEAVSTKDLARALEQVLRRAVPAKMPETGRSLRSLEDQMRRVLGVISFAYRPLHSMMEAPYTREEAVYWFLALLELIRLGQVAAQIFDDGEVAFARSEPG